MTAGSGGKAVSALSISGPGKLTGHMGFQYKTKCTRSQRRVSVFDIVDPLHYVIVGPLHFLCTRKTDIYAESDSDKILDSDQ